MLIEVYTFCQTNRNQKEVWVYCDVLKVVHAADADVGTKYFMFFGFLLLEKRK